MSRLVFLDKISILFSEYSGIRIATFTAFSLQPFYFGQGSSGYDMPFRLVVKAPGETPTSIISRKI